MHVYLTAKIVRIKLIDHGKGFPSCDSGYDNLSIRCRTDLCQDLHHPAVSRANLICCV